MPTDIKGPAIFLAQFAGDEYPFNSLSAMANWAASHGYKGIQVPASDKRLFDMEKAARSRDYCDEITVSAGTPASKSPNFPPTCWAISWRCIPRMICNAMHSLRKNFTAARRNGGNGPWGG